MLAVSTTKPKRAREGKKRFNNLLNFLDNGFQFYDLTLLLKKNESHICDVPSSLIWNRRHRHIRLVFSHTTTKSDRGRKQ